MPVLNRRQLMLAAAAPWATLSLAGAAGHAPQRLVFVILRGGMDGLMAVAAPGDPAFEAARGALAQAASPWLPLAGPFALHPLLPELHRQYQAGEALVVHATGLPYRERSHFDAQQVLESGGTRPYELSTGWLGRALAASGQRGVAMATAVPLVLRGAQDVDTWAPSVLPEPATDLVGRLQRLYADDPALAHALARARGLRDDPALQATGMGGMEAGGGAPRLAAALARKAADFLRADGGQRVAVLEMGGWDSHTNQNAPNGAAASNLRTLDAALAALRDGLQQGGSSAWSHTAVVVATEFGREVAPNGTGGTDHGSGGVAFVLGGAVRGGRVLADWPGLAPAQRHEGRDLRITTDLRSMLRPLLAQHLRVPRVALDRDVLPGSAGLRDAELLRG